MATVFGIVYGLYDPIDGTLRYIGQTTLSMSRRLCSHLTRKELSKKRHVTAWLNQLKKENQLPSIEKLANAHSREELDSLEVKLIAEAKASGTKLTNHTDGGRGLSGYILSSETRAKMSISQTGRHQSAETRAKVSAANKGRVRSEDLKKQWSLTHRSKRTTQQIELVQDSVVQVRFKTLPEYKRNSMAGSSNPRYRDDISTALILNDIRLGLSRKQVADKYGVTPRLVGKRLFQAKRAGISIQVSNRGVPTEVILQRLGSGLTRSQVSEELGISVPLIALRLRQGVSGNGF